MLGMSYRVYPPFMEECNTVMSSAHNQTVEYTCTFAVGCQMKIYRYTEIRHATICITLKLCLYVGASNAKLKPYLYIGARDYNSLYHTEVLPEHRSN